MDEFQSMVEETKALVQKEIKNKDNLIYNLFLNY